MNDLVSRLRIEARRDPEIQHSGHSILSDAADEIEALRTVMRIVGVPERDIADPHAMLALWKCPRAAGQEVRDTNDGK